MTSPEAPSRRELAGWCLYDFANSAFPTLIMMVAYAVYFTRVVAAGEDGTLLWSVAISASMVAIGLVSPLLGAIADYSASKKKWVLGFTAASVLPTALLYYVGPGDVVAGTLLFVAANICWAGGNGVYNGFLPELTTERNVGRISGYGFALGYAGGALSLLICLPLLAGGFDDDAGARSFRTSFVVAALFFALFSIPFFLWVRERAVPRVPPAGTSLLRAGYGRLSQTFHRVRSLGDLFRFLAAFLVYNDGIETVIYFSTIYAVSVLGFTMVESVYLFLAVQLTALAGSILFGHVADRIGSKGTILMTLVLWCGVVGAAYLTTTRGAFWVIALLAGVGLGSNQAASRSLMRLFVPAGHDAEFYGFFSVCGKFSALLGPMIYGLVSRTPGGHRTAILSVMAFFAIGLLILTTVNVQRGRDAARDFAAR